MPASQEWGDSVEGGALSAAPGESDASPNARQRRWKAIGSPVLQPVESRAMSAQSIASHGSVRSLDFAPAAAEDPVAPARSHAPAAEPEPEADRGVKLQRARSVAKMSRNKARMVALAAKAADSSEPDVPTEQRVESSTARDSELAGTDTSWVTIDGAARTRGGSFAVDRGGSLNLSRRFTTIPGIASTIPASAPAPVAAEGPESPNEAGLRI